MEVGKEVRFVVDGRHNDLRGMSKGVSRLAEKRSRDCHAALEAYWPALFAPPFLLGAPMARLEAVG
jgi:hypothetical protein